MRISKKLLPIPSLTRIIVSCILLTLLFSIFASQKIYAAEPMQTNSPDETVVSDDTGLSDTLPPQFTTMTIPLLLNGLIGNPKDLGITVEAVDSSNPTSLSILGFGTLKPGSGPENYLASIEFDQHLEPGIYKISVSVPKFATMQLPTSLIIAPDGTTSMSSQQLPTKLFSGDADEDGELTIFDYNLLIGCMRTISKDVEKPFCSVEIQKQTDFNEDGEIDQFDYNLFLKNIRNINSS